MKYSEDTFNTWTKPLSETEKQRAENAIRMVRSAIDECEELKQFDIEIFMQGSYANNTNVRAESDVDVCVMRKDVFYYDLPQNQNYSSYGFCPTTSCAPDYRRFVKIALQRKFGFDAVTEGNKSLKVRENTYHIQADIIPAYQYRKYSETGNNSFIEGTGIIARDGRSIINYPKIHITHGREKNKRTSYIYKKLVRILKHVKNDMVDCGKADSDKITSFLVECLVWNVPDNVMVECEEWNERVSGMLKYVFRSITNGNHKEWFEVSEMLNLFTGRKWTALDVNLWVLETMLFLK